jgi:hypothetical protein
MIDIVGGNQHCEIHVFGTGSHARADPESKNIHYHQWTVKTVTIKVQYRHSCEVSRPDQRNTASFPDMVERLGCK